VRREGVSSLGLWEKGFPPGELGPSFKLSTEKKTIPKGKQVRGKGFLFSSFDRGRTKGVCGPTKKA